MMSANFKWLPFIVWEEFLGQTDIHMHFLFYIKDLLLRNNVWEHL